MTTSKRGLLSVFLLIALSTTAFFTWTIPALAVNPDWPNGPDEDPRLEPPDDPGFEGKWYMLSYIPDAALETIRAEEIPLGSGVHADRAYQVTIGSPNVVIAVLDSGINWDSRDLTNKFYINRAEVPLPEGSGVYDANGDGAFDIRDYAGDSRVHDANGNGVVEPGDLIRIFSDGVDDDGNGYADDISGWDFFKHDNDPADDTRYGHGTGEANKAAAEANDGLGNIGVCPLCQLMMVRVADSFIADANNFAQGAVFATDSGAQVILEALGALNNTPFARDAVRYAVENGVSIAASAADENSFHHNYPATYNRTIYTNNIIHDLKAIGETTSFLALDSCTNWGPKITVSGSSGSCSSGATGVMGGALGLICSRAEEVGLAPPLSSAEVFGIVTMSATDVYVPEAEWDWTKYRSRPGWDKYFGHGRLNVRAAVDRVTPETIPPEAYIEWPGWFEMVAPHFWPVTIYGHIDARRAEHFSYRVEAAAGLEPDEEDWLILAEGETRRGAVDGRLALLDPRRLDFSRAICRDTTDHNAILVRIAVIDSLGNELEYYHSFFLYSDEDWADGFPVGLGGSGEASPLMIDLDEDGAGELIVPTAEGAVHAYKAGGVELDGWPVSTGYLHGHDPGGPGYLGSAGYITEALSGERFQGILGAVACGDLDGLGGAEVVAATLDGAVYVWGADGVLRNGFPVGLDPTFSSDPGMKLEYGIAGAPVLANLDGDPAGELEIIVAGIDQWVYAWHHDGSPVAGWPVLCREASGHGARIASTPTVGDVDGDGGLDVMVTTNERYSRTGRMYAVRADGYDHPDGPFLPAWPVELWTIVDEFLPLVGEGTPSSPVLADFDGDGRDEIVINAGVSFPVIYDGDGTLIRSMSPVIMGPYDGTYELLMGVMSSNYSIADLGDGRLTILTGGIGAFGALQLAFPGLRIPNDYLVGAWYADTGKRLLYWPRVTEDMQFANAHAVADLDGDGLPEVITGSGGHYLHAYDFYGREPEGWPKFTGGWIAATPAVGDMDGDGLLEVAVPTREGALFVWDTEGPADGNIQWSSFAHDARNTGNYGAPF